MRVCDECNYGSFEGRCVICGYVPPAQRRSAPSSAASAVARANSTRANAAILCRCASSSARAHTRAHSGAGVSDAFYCKECTMLEKDRDGCPKIINLGQAKVDLFYARKQFSFQGRQ